VASIIRVKRSTGTTAPTALHYGELAYTDGLALTANGGGRLFVGDQNEIPREVGDRYYTDMFLEPGKVAGQENKTTPANGFVAILDENRKVDEWNVDGYLNVTGVSTFIGTVNVEGESFFGNVGISSDLIRTVSGDTLYIDPYPDGLNNQGTVVIKGNLQVDGDTTAINSTEVFVDDVILKLGDVNKVRTVVGENATSGVSTIRLDSVLNLNQDDVVTGSSNLSLSGLTTITSVDTNNNIITIQDTIIGSGISTETQLTITSGYDTNTDRGISYDYNTGIGTANNKTGFFAYDDSTGRWTYIPDATITNSVVSGTKGELDLGAAYFDWAVSGIHTRGSAYFDTNGKLISTLSPEVGYAMTSNFVLTTDASNVPVWTSVLDGGSY
jgi:hypothetical protein